MTIDDPDYIMHANNEKTHNGKMQFKNTECDATEKYPKSSA